MNNPIRYVDSSGKMDSEAAVAATNWWNPVGWVAAAILVIEFGIVIGLAISAAQTARENAPTAPSTPAEGNSGKSTENPKSGNPPLKGDPNSSDDIKNKEGEVIGKRYYGPDRRAERDVDFTDHGNPKQHPEVPHEHKWDWTDPKNSLRK